MVPGAWKITFAMVLNVNKLFLRAQALIVEKMRLGNLYPLRTNNAYRRSLVSPTPCTLVFF